ncbi:zonular occludens toxin domain-containing protein [Paludibacterium denitrificans]|uniref:Zona occludens toxin N-terminal domain-containing protein n=1 Tax=Paludibacterium denitrificans TaxID=2675226 RepID=A0A844GG87_9NEIS|nr:zonular occludens toxin domain-containing protein [Paludibacterium denitrificans]MTD33907.1 hypothetical protein [Paludibacterium denitrificans]
MTTLNLLTARPGSGKTLWIIKNVNDLAERENCQVYYYGIDLTEYGKERLKNWVELDDPHKWFELPAQSIVVIDEFQKIFPKRPNGSKIPDYIQHFDTHRHYGLRLFLITALLHKSVKGRTTPNPGRTYPMRTVCGVPSAVKRLSIAAQI